VIDDGTVRCWGTNKFGQLGNGTKDDISTPMAVPKLSDAVFITTGPQHTCAALKDGTVKCWGLNDRFQLGNQSIPESLFPVVVPEMAGAATVTISDVHTCALRKNGTVACWGGLGSILPLGTVAGINTATQVSGPCALLTDGTIWCWDLERVSSFRG
jgi:alpha-tubulin suppressor-like RCC1 family protein